MERVGCFGKVRSCGDFISRHIPHAIESKFNDWLDAGLIETKHKFQQRWLDYYLTSPVWNFVIAWPAQDRSVAGVMMPSMDKVGRYFPLIALHEIEGNGSLKLDLNQDIEDLLLSSLDKGLELEDFIAGLDQIGGNNRFSREVPIKEVTRIHTHNLGNLEKISSQLLARNHLSQETANDNFAIYQHESETNVQPQSIWWTRGSEQMGPTMLCCQEFPPIEGIHATLDGSWVESGWSQINPQLEQEDSEHQSDNKKLTMEVCSD